MIAVRVVDRAGGIEVTVGEPDNVWASGPVYRVAERDLEAHPTLRDELQRLGLTHYAISSRVPCELWRKVTK